MPDVQRLKNVIKGILPPLVRRQVQRELARQRHSGLIARTRQNREFRADATRYAKYADWGETATSRPNAVHLEGQLIRDYHRIEKGLALASPKRPFGSDVLARLDALIPIAEAADPDAAYLGAAESARKALLTWNSGGDSDATVAPVHELADRGVEVERFFSSRHSVRDFSEEPVSPNDVRRAVELALFSPSVCNRQPWRIRLFFGDGVPEVLAYQNGNRGFTHSIPALALISVQLGLFAGPGERNQAWIEGGIFSSSLVWALHGLGLDSCMLNLSITTEVADALREASGMPQSEVPIMMIAIGRGRPGHRVARSPRRATSEVIVANRNLLRGNGQ